MGDTKVRGTYILISPPHRISFTWGIPDNAELPEGSSTVEIYPPPTATTSSSSSSSSPTATSPSHNEVHTSRDGICDSPSSPKQPTPEHQTTTQPDLTNHATNMETTLNVRAISVLGLWEGDEIPEIGVASLDEYPDDDSADDSDGQGDHDDERLV